VRTNNLHCKAMCFVISTHLKGWFNPRSPLWLEKNGERVARAADLRGFLAFDKFT